MWDSRANLATQSALENQAPQPSLQVVLETNDVRVKADASHIVRTPLTIALGHAEILQRTTDDAVAARDAGVVIDELTRLKETTDRLLELATSHQPDFVRPVLTPLREVVADACDRWSAKGAPVRLGKVDDAAVRLDPDRLLEALDELIGNAVNQTPPGRPVEISARRENGCEVIGVAVLIELAFLNGRERLRGYAVESLIVYDH